MGFAISYDTNDYKLTKKWNIGFQLVFFIKTLKAFILVLSISVGNYVSAEVVDEDLAEAIITKGKIINTISTKKPYSENPRERASNYHVIYKNKIYICGLGYKSKQMEDGSGRFIVDISKVIIRCSSTK